MNMNFGIKKAALGGAAALAIAGGALFCCKNDDVKVSETPREIPVIHDPKQVKSQLDFEKACIHFGTGYPSDKVQAYDNAIASTNRAIVELRKKEVADSIDFVNNPNAESMNKYEDSRYVTSQYKEFAGWLNNQKAEEIAEKTAMAKAKATADSIAVEYAKELKNKNL